MNAKFEIEVVDQNVVVTAFRTPGGTTELFERIAQEARSHVPDVTTKKGRDQIGSLALKISKSKTFIEKCGKELVAEQKAKIKVIDDDRIATVKKFDDLRNEILAPRDAWEQAEKDRIQAIQDKVSQFDSGRVDTGSPLQLILSVIAEIEAIAIDESFAEYQEQAKLQKYECLEVLRKVQVDREKYEAEQAELERLRLAEQARLQREHEERIAREAAEKATREAEEKARFEADRVQREKLEAEQREARLRAEKEAALLREEQLKQQAIEREKQAEIDRQNAIEAERKRIEAEQIAKVEAERKAAEKREANVEHMRTINNEALSAISLTGGVDIETAKLIVIAIAKNQIPHVSIKY